MKDKYYVVSMNDDGEWSFNIFDTLEEIMEEYGIDEDPKDYKEGCHPAEGFVDNIDDYTPGHILIRGQVLTPHPVQQVTKWEFRGKME